MFAGAATGECGDQAQPAAQARLSLAAEIQAWQELSLPELAHLAGGTGALCLSPSPGRSAGAGDAPGEGSGMSGQQRQARRSENRSQLCPRPLAAGFEFDRWLNTPGWPPYLPDLSPGEQLMKPAEELAELWAADGLNMEAIEAVDIAVWRTYQLVYFLDQVLQRSPLPEGEGQDTSWGSGP